MQKIIITILLLAVTACSPLTVQQKTENKIAKKLDRMERKHPEAFKNATTQLVRIDTLIEEVVLAGESRIDTVQTEKLVKEYIRDTVKVKEFITRLLRETSDTISVDSLGISLDITGTNLAYRLQRDSIYIEKEQEVKTVTITNTEVVRKSFYQDWKFWLLCIAIFVGWIFRGALGQVINRYKP